MKAIILIALVMALGLVSVIAVDILLIVQQIDAAPPPVKGCRTRT